MSVAVSPYLLPSQAVGLVNGQQTDLLDALLASCQKSAMNPPHPGFGRSLQPYFTTEALPFSVEQPTSKSSSAKPRNKQRRSKGKSNNASASSSDEESNQTAKKITSPAQPLPKTQKPHDTNKSQTIKAIHKQAGTVVGRAWAGPAYGMAPSASEIPTPSDFLLV